MPRGRRAARERALIDRWILSELALTTRAVRAHMDAYRRLRGDRRAHRLRRRALELVRAPLARSLLGARARARTSSTRTGRSTSALTDSRSCVAPFLPFRDRGPVAEPGRAAVRRRASPRACTSPDYPEPDLAAIDEPLSREMRAVREIVSLGSQVRTGQQAARAPAARRGRGGALRSRARAARCSRTRPSCATSSTCTSSHLAPTRGAYVTYQVKPNFRALGPRVGKRDARAQGRARGAPTARALLARARGERPRDARDRRRGRSELGPGRDRGLARGARGLRGRGRCGEASSCCTPRSATR